MIGTASSPAARDHLDAVDPGQPEVEDHDVGTARAASAAPPRRRRPGRPRSRGPGGWCARPRRICGSSSTTSTRLVTHGLAAGNDDHHREPAAGVSSTVSSPPIASMKPRATARPRPTPSGTGVAEALERLEHPFPVAAAMPGPGPRRGGGRGPPPGLRRATGRPAGACDRRWRRGWPAPARAARVGHDAGSVSGTSTRPPRRGRARLRERARPRPPPGPTVAQHEAQRPALQAAHVEQVPDEAVEPVGLLLDGGEELGGLVVATTRRRAGGGWSTDALIDASGVRRSWDTARSSAVRSSSASASPAAPAASWAPTRRRSIAAASPWATNGSSTRRSSAGTSGHRASSSEGASCRAPIDCPMPLWEPPVRRGTPADDSMTHACPPAAGPRRASARSVSAELQRRAPASGSSSATSHRRDAGPALRPRLCLAAPPPARRAARSTSTLTTDATTATKTTMARARSPASAIVTACGSAAVKIPVDAAA